VCSPSATIFVFSLSVFARISLRNLQTIQFCWREAGVITVLYFLTAPVLLILHCLLPFSFNCADSTVQVTDPGPSPTQCSHSYSGRFNPIRSFQVVFVIFFLYKPALFSSSFLCAPSFIVAAIFCSSWDECPTNLWTLPLFSDFPNMAPNDLVQPVAAAVTSQVKLCPYAEEEPHIWF
jgi:hypothetical protein